MSWPSKAEKPLTPKSTLGRIAAERLEGKERKVVKKGRKKS